MMAVIFEFEIYAGRAEDYLRLAKQLKSELANVDGFISVERYISINHPNCYLSLSFWKDEQAISMWRNNGHHQLAQQTGKSELFNHYRLRVASIIGDYDIESEVPASGN